VSSIKCSHCGSVHFLTEATCKRCGAQLASNRPPLANSNPQGIVLEDGYVLSPPPTHLVEALAEPIQTCDVQGR
jgi:hypothetical protein